MVKIFKRKSSLFIKGLADREWKVVQSVKGSLGIAQFHRTGLVFFRVRSLMLASMEAAISSAVLKGP